MLVNSSELERLAWFDSRYFDKEGYLFVREKHDGIFSQWKTETYIERLCRLKGNLFFILATKTLNDTDTDESKTRTSQELTSSNRIIHILILEEFVIKLIDETTNKHFGFAIEFIKGDTAKPFYFATISHQDRDNWIQSIHLSSFAYLRSLYSSLLDQLAILNNNNNNYNTEESNLNTKLESSSSSSSLFMSVACESLYIDNPYLCPNLTVHVYFRTLFKPWNFLGETETIQSRCPRFLKNLILPSNFNSSIEFKFKLYDIIEPVTLTRTLLGQSYIELKNFSQDKNYCIKLELKSVVNHNQVIGLLAIYFSNFNSQKVDLKRNDSLDSIYSSQKDVSLLISCNGNRNGNPLIERKREAITNRSLSVPNIEFNNNKSTINTFIMDENDSKIFTNTIQRSFQFTINNELACINEFMAESSMCIILPQLLMNIFMDEEKMLMNCVTYSLGEVKPEWQRSQMKILESHLRLVNVLTESTNHLSQYQADHSFRSSQLKHEQFLQFVPINFHLQRCLVTNGFEKKLIKNIFTVGAFTSHSLGYETGGLTKQLESAKRNLMFKNVWKAMVNFLKITFLKKQIEYNLKKILQYYDEVIPDQVFDEISIFNKIDSLCKEMQTILSHDFINKSIDEALTLCDATNHNSSLINGNLVNSFERSTSLYDYRDSKNGNANMKMEMKRTNSFPYDYDDQIQEIEPIDLIELNIQASLMSLYSKLINKSCILTKNELEPSQRKLIHAIDSLHRTASICYAYQAIKLDRDQMESFYLIRLRRDMLFSQILTSLIIATQSNLSSVSFLQKAIETGTVLFNYESLLSCYAEEMGMLEDMVYIIEEINSCVNFIFEKSSKDLQPRIEGNSFSLKVTFYVSSSIFSLSSIECSITGIIFNIGINEQATCAETLGIVKFQNSINKENYAKLESYISILNSEDVSLGNNLIALKNEIWSNRVKNVRVLQLCEEIIDHLNGLRFTICKSAKDRTSMAVTLEEARMLTKLFSNFSEIESSQTFQQILDILRIEGTRRENTLKNVGINKYAFNTLQLMTFPKLYRAPHGTYSSIDT